MKTETIIILAVVALGGFYLYQQSKKAQNSSGTDWAALEQGAGNFLGGLFA